MIIAFNSLKKNIFPATVGKIGNDGNFLVYLRLSRNFVGFYHNFSMENFLCDSFLSSSSGCYCILWGLYVEWYGEAIVFYSRLLCIR